MRRTMAAVMYVTILQSYLPGVDGPAAVDQGTTSAVFSRAVDAGG